MTADVELLPLPEWCSGCGESLPRDMQNYARANVAHATAAKDAENEALRAEVDQWRQAAITQSGEMFQQKDRAERLAEALRSISELDEREGDGLGNARSIARAAIHPTAAQEESQ